MPSEPGQIYVYYAGNQIFPSPLVSQSEETLVVGGNVFGHINSITLNGYLTGLGGQGAQDYEKVCAIFSGNFNTLLVTDNLSNQLYSWSQVAIDNISLDNSDYPINGAVKYTIQLKSYSDIVSGVVNPENSYSFQQQEDGTVNLTHKISAQGIRNSTDPLSNAINFCNVFINNTLAPNFISSGSPILLSETELINRVESIYSITQTYCFNTGSSNSYIQVSTLNLDQSNDKDYLTLDYNSKYQVSPINGNLPGLVTYVNSNNYLNEILSLYGIGGNNIYLNTFSVTQDSGAGIIELKTSYISGLTNDVTGYFDYTINLESDLVMQKNIWRVDGDFISHGPISFRQQLLNNFISNNAPFQGYLENIISSSPLALPSPNGYGNSNIVQTNQLLDFSISQNTGMALLKSTIATRDLDPSYSLINPKFSINYLPPLYQYELLASSTQEGQFCIQDLQMIKQAHISFETECNSSGNVSNFTNLGTLFANISGIYVNGQGFNVKLVVTSGILEKAIECEFLLPDIAQGTTFSTYKINGSLSSNFLRKAGYSFGN